MTSIENPAKATPTTPPKDKFLRGRTKVWWLGLVAITGAVVLVPLGGSDYLLRLSTLVLIYTVLVLGLNFFTGFAGPLSLLHLGLFGVGAYASSLLRVEAGWGFVPATIIGTIVVMLVAAVMGSIALVIVDRLIFSVVTIGLSEIIRLVILNWREVTRGAAGLPHIPRPEFASTDIQLYIVVVAVAVIAHLALAALVRSRLGIAAQAIRWDEVLAVAAGIDTYRIKLIVLVISGGFAGIAGSLYSVFVGALGPDMLTISRAVDVLVMLVVGGIGTLMGPLIGAATVIMVPEYLRFVADFRLVVFGALLVVVVIYMPDGIAGLVRRLTEGGRQARRPGTFLSRGPLIGRAGNTPETGESLSESSESDHGTTGRGPAS